MCDQFLELPGRQLEWDKIITITLKKGDITFMTADNMVVVTVDEGARSMAFLVAHAIQARLSHNTERVIDLTCQLRHVFPVRHFTMVALAAYGCIVLMLNKWMTYFSSYVFGFRELLLFPASSG